METRSIKKSDLASLKSVLDNCELFPSEYLGDMIADYFENPNTEDIWFTTEINDEIISIAYCAPMKFTNGTYNLYAIGVKNNFQNKGVGTSMMAYIENILKNAGQRILIVETSSTTALMPARKFYLKSNYRLEASIPDFWDEGDDKVVFWKKL